MNVLSLFDGMSCGRIALDRIGAKVSTYYASELDKHAIKVTQHNWPNTVQLGDVTKWEEWDLDWSSIELLIGGSPCQGFSFSGKQLAFNDPRSKLFFVYVEILKHINTKRSESGKPPVKFMLENVKMKKEFLAVISDHLGVEPLFINSGLVSAQSRPRYYWCNWDISLPEDKGIMVPDILLEDVDQKYFCDKGQLNRLKTSTDVKKRFSVINPEKAACMTARQYANWKGNFVTGDMLLRARGNNSGGKRTGKATSITTSSWEHNLHLIDDGMIRRFTPVECERLQTVPDNYSSVVSDSQRYKMLGNGWTVDVIAHIFSGAGFEKRQDHFVNKTSTPEGDKDLWKTPRELFDALNDEFGFTLDVCADEGNALCEHFFTAENSALSNQWLAKAAFMNPPYSQTQAFLTKANEQAKLMDLTVVALVNANTDTQWFAEAAKTANEIRLLTGRVGFIRADGKKASGNTKGQCLIIWRGRCETPCVITMVDRKELEKKGLPK